MKNIHLRRYPCLPAGRLVLRHGQVGWMPRGEESRPCNHITITRKPRPEGGELHCSVSPWPPHSSGLRMPPETGFRKPQLASGHF